MSNYAKIKNPTTVKGKNPSQSAIEKGQYPVIWQSIIRPLILILDGFNCTVCGLHSVNNHVDHINGNPLDCRYVNLKTLCARHHGMKTKGKMTLCNRVIEANDVIFAIPAIVPASVLKVWEERKYYSNSKVTALKEKLIVPAGRQSIKSNNSGK